METHGLFLQRVTSTLRGLVVSPKYVVNFLNLSGRGKKEPKYLHLGFWLVLRLEEEEDQQRRLSKER